jgi:hypothetical protein
VNEQDWEKANAKIFGRWHYLSVAIILELKLIVQNYCLHCHGGCENAAKFSRSASEIYRKVDPSISTIPKARALKKNERMKENNNHLISHVRQKTVHLASIVQSARIITSGIFLPRRFRRLEHGQVQLIQKTS